MTVEPHLTVFNGLDALEKDGDKSGIGSVYKYASNEEAFKVAVDAVKALL